jgi:hypothetical protein
VRWGIEVVQPGLAYGDGFGVLRELVEFIDPGGTVADAIDITGVDADGSVEIRVLLTEAEDLVCVGEVCGGDDDGFETAAAGALQDVREVCLKVAVAEVAVGVDQWRFGHGGVTEFWGFAMR